MIHRLFSLSGAVALVTGSSSGIGLGLARGFAEAGARVVVNGRRVEAVDAAVEGLRARGGEAFAAPFDVTDSGRIGEAVARIEAEFGPIDILVNNAGVQRRGPLETYDEETWREVMATNLDSVFLVSRAVARRMIERRRGRIITIGSALGELARPGAAAYAASKGGVKMLTRGMATDWARHGIRVNAIAPGFFRTELTQALADDETFSRWLSGRTPMGRWGEIDELVGAAIFLASDASGFVTGHVLHVDGGLTVSL